MKKRLIIPISLLAAAILISLIIFSGCGNLEIEGPELINAKPWISWAIVPSDSLVHSFNPQLRWFGADQDGMINDYIYGVFQGDYMDSLDRVTSLVIPDTMEWISLGIVTSAIIPLVASPDTSDTIGQYVVLRAIDDAGDSSNIINRYLYRTNHKPTCIVTVPSDPQWILPDTTSSWSGVGISWEGGDSLDYPEMQPNFIWEVRIYGPFDSEPDLQSPDTSDATLLRYITDNDPDEDSLKIVITSARLKNLRTGFYIIYVRNFDDANVSSIPSLGVIHVFEPHWIYHADEAKDILLVNHSSYQGTYYGELEPYHRDSVEQFYTAMVESAGYTEDDYNWFNGEADFAALDTLYKYRMVIALDTDWRNMILESQQNEYGDYLDVGGKIWVIGRRSFDLIPSSSTVAYGMAGLPFVYMNLDGAYLNASNNPNRVDFTGASPLIGTFPRLQVDTLRVSYTSWPANHYAEALFGVGFLIRLGQSEPIYTYNALEPLTSLYHDMPVAIRYDSGTYKTSYFAFPLYFIKDAGAFQAADLMLQWFLEE